MLARAALYKLCRYRHPITNKEIFIPSRRPTAASLAPLGAASPPALPSAVAAATEIAAGDRR